MTSNYYPNSIIFCIASLFFFLLHIDTNLINADLYFLYNRNHFINFFEIFDSNLHQNSFRPLSIFFEHNISQLYRVYGKNFHTLGVLIPSIMIGILAVSISLTTSLFGGKTLSQLVAVIISIFSISSISAFYHNLFSIWQLPVVTLNCLGLLFFIKFLNPDKNKKLFFTVFFICVFIAPYFREVGMVMSITAFLYVFIFPKKFSLIQTILICVLFLNALIPKLFPYLLGIYSGELTFFFSGEEINKSAAIRSVSDLNWLRSIFVFNQFSPLLWAIVLIGLVKSSHEFKYANNEKMNPLILFFLNLLNVKRTLTILSYSTFFVFFIFLGTLNSNFSLYVCTFFIFITMFVFGILNKIEIFLFFCVSYAGLFLLASVHEAQGVYVIPALSILAGFCLEKTYLILKEVKDRKFSKTYFSIFLLSLFFSVGEFILNPIISKLNLISITSQHESIANWIRVNLNQGDLIITDTMALQDIFYNIKGKNKFYPHQEKVLAEVDWINGVAFRGSKFDFLKTLQTYAQRNRDIFFIHQYTSSSDGQIPLPVKALKIKQKFYVPNIGFEIDPTRFIFQKIISRNYAPGEWDTSYGWRMFSKSKDVWLSGIEILKIESSHFKNISVNDLMYVNRPSAYGPFSKLIQKDEKNSSEFIIVNNYKDFGYDIVLIDGYFTTTKNRNFKESNIYDLVRKIEFELETN